MKLLDVPVSALGQHPDALLRLFAGELQVLLVRDVFSAEILRIAAERLQGEARPIAPVAVEYPDQPERPQVRVLGHSLYSIDETLVRYFEGAAALRRACDVLFAGALDLESAVAALLGRIAGGRDVAPLRGNDGRVYAPGRIPFLAEGIGIPPHTDNEFFERPGFREVRDLVVPTLVSFIVPLQIPPDGGHLEVFPAGTGKAGPARRGGGPLQDEDLAGAPHLRVEPRLGDVILFDSGRLPHRVTAPRGTPRLTFSGSLALGARTESVYYCG